MNLKNYLKTLYYYSIHLNPLRWYKLYSEFKITKHLYQEWLLYKQKHNIQNTVVHYYAVCWNEIDFLPFMLKHYESSINKFHIYDNESTDGSISFLQENGKVEIHTFSTKGRKDLNMQMYIKNEAWKNSRGKADYVIVCDIDELLHHTSMSLNEYFDSILERNITIIKPKGYEMVSKHYPDTNKPLLQQIKKGIDADEYFSKSILFDPYKIIDINYSAGAHNCYPIGKLKFDYSALLLHFKNLSFDHLLKRLEQYKQRGSDQTQKNISVHYKYSNQRLKMEYDEKVTNRYTILE